MSILSLKPLLACEVFLTRIYSIQKTKKGQVLLIDKFFEVAFPLDDLPYVESGILYLDEESWTAFAGWTLFPENGKKLQKLQCLF